MEAVAVYRDGETRASHLAEAAWTVRIQGGQDPYADPVALLSAGLDSGADAVFPGTAVLGHSAEFAMMVMNVGMAWIGPKAEHLAALADVVSARARARGGGLEVIPGSGPLSTMEEADAWLSRLRGPLHVRSTVRGGVAKRFEDTASAREWLLDGAPWPCLIERAVPGGRRVIVLVVGDGQGNAVHLGEHEVSVADGAGGWLRECPSSAVDPATRARLGAAAADACASLAWLGVCGVEMLLSPDGHAWCTDLDPAMPVGFGLHEAVCGVDLVAAQIALASGEDLGWDQAEILPTGAAVELQIRATGPGTVKGIRGIPRGMAVAVRARGERIDPASDPVLVVLRAKAPTRQAALVRLRAALDGIVVDGVPTNREALRALFDRRDVWEGHAAFLPDGQW